MVGLTEEIELIKNRITLLDNNISFSTISVRLSNRLEVGDQEHYIPFKWISNLHPLYSISDNFRGKLKLDLGDEFAIFSKDKIFHAENSRGLSVKISSINNKPLGNNNFWQTALKHYLEDYYSTSILTSIKIGDKEALGIEFLSKDRESYKYFVGIIVIKEQIHIIEIYSPNSNDNFSAIYNAFRDGSIK